jgi:hypothetical protein
MENEEREEKKQEFANYQEEIINFITKMYG